MKFKRIAVAVAVTALGATLASRWRRHAARRKSDAGGDADPDEPPCDEDVSAFIETLARPPHASERLAQAGRSPSVVHGNGAPGDS